MNCRTIAIAASLIWLMGTTTAVTQSISAHGLTGNMEFGRIISMLEQLRTDVTAVREEVRDLREHVQRLDGILAKAGMCGSKAAGYDAEMDQCVVTEYRVCVQVIDFGGRRTSVSNLACTPWGGGMSDYSFDDDRYDPDGVRIQLEQRLRHFSITD